MKARPITIEPHCSPRTLAELHNISEDTVVRWVRDEPGVIKMADESNNGRRTRCEYRVPWSVWQRILEQRTAK
jgi:hypothetical protein